LVLAVLARQRGQMVLILYLVQLLLLVVVEALTKMVLVRLAVQVVAVATMVVLAEQGLLVKVLRAALE
jgi:hypothetical protein